MGDNITGFIGGDKYEIILYLSRILFHLGKKVLLVDYSESEALYHSISIPDMLSEKHDSIDYCGIDFIKGQYFTLDKQLQYDIILMDLGFCEKRERISLCSKVVYVTDLQRHNVNKIINFESIENLDTYLIIKDVVPCKIKPEYIISQVNQMNQVIDKNRVFILNQDPVDLKYKIHCQYNHKFSFGKLSISMKYCLKEMTKKLNVSLDEKCLNNAYRKAERGN